MKLLIKCVKRVIKVLETSLSAKHCFTLGEHLDYSLLLGQAGIL